MADEEVVEVVETPPATEEVVAEQPVETTVEPGTTEEGGEEVIAEPVEDKGKKGGVQKRISEIVAQRETEKQMKEFYKEQWEKQLAASQKPPESQPIQPIPGGPQPEQFNDYADFVRAQVRFEMQQEQAMAQWSEHSKRIEEKVEKSIEKYPDFVDVATQGHAIVKSNPTAEAAIAESDMFSDVAYYLGKNPAEAKRLAALPPLLAAKEVGKLEAKLAIAPPPVKKVSGAPEPVKTVGGSGGAIIKSWDDPNLTTEERTALWESERAK